MQDAQKVLRMAEQYIERRGADALRELLNLALDAERKRDAVAAATWRRVYGAAKTIIGDRAEKQRALRRQAEARTPRAEVPRGANAGGRKGVR
jgi:hypothetical protein